MTQRGTEAATEAEHSSEELAYLDEHAWQLRAATSEGGYVAWSLATGFVLGLGAHVVGYFLQTSATSEPFGLLSDLLYALGLALWTGVVVALFIEVLPAAKRRQVRRYVDAFEAAKVKQAGRRPDDSTK